LARLWEACLGLTRVGLEAVVGGEGGLEVLVGGAVVRRRGLVGLEVGGEQRSRLR
jgi:hypothetical protein